MSVSVSVSVFPIAFHNSQSYKISFEANELSVETHAYDNNQLRDDFFSVSPLSLYSFIYF